MTEQRIERPFTKLCSYTSMHKGTSHNKYSSIEVTEFEIKEMNNNNENVIKKSTCKCSSSIQFRTAKYQIYIEA